jgi:hypothetical protein
MLILVAFVLILFLESARRQRKEVLVQEYQYRLFALRDELREYAMRDPRISQNWVFKYLDSTIAKSIRFMPSFSIWFLIGLMLTHGYDDRFEKLTKHLEREYDKPENSVHRQIAAKLTYILQEYILKRHVLMIFVSFCAAALPATVVASIKRLKRKSLALAIESPETSTLHSFAPKAVLAGT